MAGTRKKKSSDLPDKLCNVCGSGVHSDKIVTCSNCNNSEHLYCMKVQLFEVPQKWTCHICARLQKNEHVKSIGGKVKLLDLEELPLRVVRRRKKPLASKFPPDDDDSAEHAPPACPISQRTSCLSNQNVAPDEGPQSMWKTPVRESEVSPLPVPDNDALQAVPSGCCTGAGSSRSHPPPVTILISIPVLSSYGTSEPHWKGNIEISNVAFADIYDGMVAYYASQMKQKAYEAAKLLPEKLKMEIVRRRDVWPKAFSVEPPLRNDIALSFLPKDEERPKQKFAHLIERVDSHDLGMQCQSEKIHLLVFSSKQLPTGSQQLNGAYFLWGVFLPLKLSYHALVPILAPQFPVQDIPRACFHPPLRNPRISPSEHDAVCRPCVSQPGTSIGNKSTQDTAQEKVPEECTPNKAVKSSASGTENRVDSATHSDLSKGPVIAVSQNSPAFGECSPTGGKSISAGLKKSSILQAVSSHASSSSHSKYPEDDVESKKKPLFSTPVVPTVASARDAFSIHGHGDDKMTQKSPLGGWDPQSCMEQIGKETQGNVAFQSGSAPASKFGSDRKSPYKPTSRGGWVHRDFRDRERKEPLGNRHASRSERASDSKWCSPSPCKMPRQSAATDGWRSWVSEKVPDSWQPQQPTSGGGCWRNDWEQKQALGNNRLTEFRAPDSRWDINHRTPKKRSPGRDWRDRHRLGLEQREASADGHIRRPGKRPHSRWSGDATHLEQSRWSGDATHLEQSASRQGWEPWDGSKKSGHSESKGNAALRSELIRDLAASPPGFPNCRSSPSGRLKFSPDSDHAQQGRTNSRPRGRFESSPKHLSRRR